MPADAMKARGASAPESVWRPGPRFPKLPRGAVHVWRADLDALPEELSQLLSPGERRRAAEILAPARRGRWERGRGLLRLLLARYARGDPRSLRLRAGRQGKPALATPRGPAFNLSHSGATALYAFAATGAVGVDVELLGGERDRAALAPRILGPQAAGRLLELAPRERERELLSAWTRHEAYLKCLGLGLGGGSGSRPSARSAPGTWVGELDAGPGAVAALAAREPPESILLWEWRPAPGGPPRSRRAPLPAR